jgi:hypothetical protein
MSIPRKAIDTVTVEASVSLYALKKAYGVYYGFILLSLANSVTGYLAYRRADSAERMN